MSRVLGSVPSQNKQPTTNRNIYTQTSAHICDGVCVGGGISIKFGSGEMIQWVEYLLFKCEDLSSNPQSPSEAGISSKDQPSFSPKILRTPELTHTHTSIMHTKMERVLRPEILVYCNVL